MITQRLKGWWWALFTRSHVFVQIQLSRCTTLPILICRSDSRPNANRILIIRTKTRLYMNYHLRTRSTRRGFDKPANRKWFNHQGRLWREQLPSPFLQWKGRNCQYLQKLRFLALVHTEFAVPPDINSWKLLITHDRSKSVSTDAICKSHHLISFTIVKYVWFVWIEQLRLGRDPEDRDDPEDLNTHEEAKI